MQKTEQRAEQAANRACKELLRITRATRRQLPIDELHKLDAVRILQIQEQCAGIITKHIRDCYISSWITEAEELERLYGDELPALFLARLSVLKKNGPDRVLYEAADRYMQTLPKSKNTPEPLRLIDGVVDYPKPKNPVETYTINYFTEYIQQVQEIKKLPAREQNTLMKWRTGPHGESGLGYRLDTLLRTESDTAQAEASADVYEEAGIPLYRFCSVLDDATCEKCKALNGEIFPLSKRKAGVNFPRIHPRCRCWIEPVWHR